MVDASHNRMQIYTHKGQFLFKINYPTKELLTPYENADLEEIFQLEDMLYVTDKKLQLHIFQKIRNEKGIGIHFISIFIPNK